MHCVKDFPDVREDLRASSEGEVCREECDHLLVGLLRVSVHELGRVVT